MGRKGALVRILLSRLSFVRYWTGQIARHIAKDAANLPVFYRQLLYKQNISEETIQKVEKEIGNYLCNRDYSRDDIFSGGL